MKAAISTPLLLAAVLALSACAVGPDYRVPEVAPAQIERAAAAGFDQSRFQAAWWRQFDDPTLDALVGEALAENRELRIAFARLRAARSIRDDVTNDRFPTVTAGASAEYGEAQQPGFGEERSSIERYDLGLDMAWELDLFGRVQRRIEASEAQSEAAEAELYQLQVSLIAELVDAYGQLRGAQLRERIARENLENQRNSHRLTEQLRDAGVGSELDVLRADARLAATEASLPQLQAQQTRATNRIATLLGQRADRLSVDLAPRELPAIAKALPIGDPTELLRRRPDILAAERQLAAATSNVGVATADLFPRVSLSGFLGFIAGRGSQIGSSAAQAWGVAPSITWAAFDMGSVRARLRGAKADAEGALASYEQQVLLALEESENAFSDYARAQERLLALLRQSGASRAAAEQAAIRYREGTVDFLVLLDAERERLAAEDAQAQAEVEVYRGVVGLYKALGGGWQLANG
ncbi:TolC family protein [Pseudomonas sp. Choline-3u-10]|jgi:outer membrane protein, multidrug efflux system|uniref:efflux transporter outer membrane subunit n=1 Tax=Pseudomonadaceae TaxID=135621 RepID=UPI000617C130|nr:MULTISPECIES: TolC family protein [Pseudomonadaceae]MAL38243.1 TolC family protein [Pseudomonas sp.]MBU0949917.1 TolC family protein [Gammaproteobacteria bacterium]MBK3795746.1 efflux transporter outer membrane subunit [Stutzerimonas stutzeri]MBK3877899.1 efflux transporter outer membrane subunit [Stutzerimonas stutzeri]PKG92545.1 TolC family protein [Pseudomonas sp. Choline-3u-10]|tara:strand:+ start:759 stop:2162 length:1404 start_codon:yes stop_codon:yes gene_type:complete